MVKRKTEATGISDYCYKIIQKKSWQFSIKTGIPQDQLESEGLLEYVLCLKKYKAENGNLFITFFYRCLENRLIDYTTEWYRQLPAFTWDSETMPFPEIAHNDNTERRYALKEMLAKLSPSAQGIAMLLDTCANEIIEDVDKLTVKNPHCSKHLKGALRRFLIKLGWEQCIINKAFTELEMAVQAF
jgi:hypothetical protein